MALSKHVEIGPAASTHPVSGARAGRPAKEPSMPVLPELHTLLTGLAYGESPRWHDDRLWFSDMGAGEVVAADLDGNREVIARLPAMPGGTAGRPSGRRATVPSRDRLPGRRGPAGSLVTDAGLTGLGSCAWGDMVRAGRGSGYIRTIGFDFGRGEPGPGTLPLVAP